MSVVSPGRTRSGIVHEDDDWSPRYNIMPKAAPSR